ncbi:MAG: type I glyceraldehyde-3-phosphate dehydrogenase, partial [Candidatus Aenigmarchaeota archaeon]|nr:type I glyceraldehyde-3-phosphate dehydrogenase [Candidatus Aenigmarchaeota archaeon]
SEEINQAFTSASKGNLQDILAVSDQPLVSSDYIQSPYSAIVDLSMTRVVAGDLAKIIIWYDNEWGYSVGLVKMANLMIK